MGVVCFTWSLYKVSDQSQLGSQPAIRLYYLLFALLFLFLLPVPGNGSIISGLQKYYCKIRSSQCALIGCHPKEEQIGRCSLRGRKCCQKKK
ncbi:TPA: beta-defensin 103B-like [Bos taurus]|nr:TPA: beta-defensin 103B-like [Bos taurus]